MSETIRYPAQLRERAIRMVREHRGDYGSEWAAIQSVAGKLGIGAPETLRKWIQRAEVDGGQRPGLTTSEREWLVKLEGAERELRRANEVLKAATVFFARELDPRPPRP